MQLAAGLPYLGVIAFTRSKAIAAIALLILLLGPMATVGPMHSCDQKGCDDCSNLLLFQLVVLAPLGCIILAMLLAGRIFRLYRSQHSEP
jgi:hypothetical protein